MCYRVISFSKISDDAVMRDAWQRDEVLAGCWEN